jgi:hypothetical protein
VSLPEAERGLAELGLGATRWRALIETVIASCWPPGR